MYNILLNDSKSALLARINALTPEAKSLWGIMSLNEMICHVSDQIRMAIGEINTAPKGSFVQKTLLKYLVLFGMPIPKGKIETVKELNQKFEGTKPKDFLIDKKNLISLINEFESSYREGTFIVHPAFGKLSKKQWARLIYLHLDHHLKQFGV